MLIVLDCSSQNKIQLYYADMLCCLEILVWEMEKLRHSS